MARMLSIRGCATISKVTIAQKTSVTRSHQVREESRIHINVQQFFDELDLRRGSPKFDISSPTDDAKNIRSLTVKQTQRVEAESDFSLCRGMSRSPTASGAKLHRLAVSKESENFPANV